MKLHSVRPWPSGTRQPREAELAWKIAETASAGAPLDAEAAAMAANRIIDNAAVALAAIDRAPVAGARAQALANPRPGGATLIGLGSETTVHAPWAAWANTTAVRELDFNDSFFASDSGHPGDMIAPVIAVAQQCGLTGADLLRGIVMAYEIHVNLVKGIALNPHRIDHVAHLGPAIAAGLGAMLRLDTGIIYQAVQHAAHVSLATRQVRKGAISTYKANAPAHVGKLAIEAVDRAMRGATSPSPIWEGDYGIIAILLGGPDAEYQVPLPDPGEPARAILETYPKAHSAGYHGQAVIDLAFRMRERIADLDAVEEIVLHTKKLTHLVMGSGANDPEKYDPNATRETLDHSSMFIFAIALEDGSWDHDASYAPERVSRENTVRLWRKIRTVEDPEWNRRFDEPPPLEKDHGLRAVVTFADGTTLEDELAVADAHPRGARPFSRPDYEAKFRALTREIVTPAEADRFLGLAGRIETAGPDDLAGITPEAVPERAAIPEAQRRGIL